VIFQRSAKWRPETLDDVPVIGRIPLTPSISHGINRADPLMHREPDSPQAQAFMDITAVLRQKTS
jgi:MinD-like ATPase involved in chromosome partitioning or flagellar assembly